MDVYLFFGGIHQSSCHEGQKKKKMMTMRLMVQQLSTISYETKNAADRHKECRRSPTI